jgi:hypothetical protein
VTEGLWYDDFDNEEMTDEELNTAAQAADDFASHRIQSEEY